MQISLTHDYDSTARAVWEVATDWDCFLRAMKGVASFRDIPDTPLHAGQVIDAEVSLFGVLPWQPHRMELNHFDPVGMTFQSREVSTGVRRWDHQMQVTETPSGARLTDTIEIEGTNALATAALKRWARFVYTRRHAPRLEMLAERTLSEV